MKVLMAILFIVLMIGVTPAFAANSPADQQAVTSVTDKGNNNSIGDVSKLTNQSSNTNAVDASDISDKEGFIDGYDDNGNYIGHYIVVSDTSNSSDGAIGDNDQLDDNVDYTTDNPSDVSSISDEDDNTNDPNVYDLYNVADSISPSDQSENNGELVDDQSNENVGTVDPSSEYNNVDELDNNTIINPDNQSPESETTSQMETNIPTNSGHLLVNLVDGLFGTVQTILGGLGI